MKKLLLLLSAALTALAVSACGASAPAAQPAPQNTAAADGHKAVLVIDGRLRCAMNRAPTIYTAACPLRFRLRIFPVWKRLPTSTSVLTKRGKRLAAIPLRAIYAFISRGAI